MKKIKTLLLCMILVCAFSFLASCKNEEEQPHEHSWGEWVVIVEPTCDAEGEKESKCTECNQTKKEKIDALEHEYVLKEVLAEASCTTSGISVYECKHCGILKEENKGTLPHDIKNGSCVNCGATEGEVTKHTVTVEFNGGEGTDPSGEYKHGEKVYLPNPAKDGYIFDGWYTTTDFKEDSRVDIYVVLEKDVTLYAKWDYIGSLVTLDANGGYVQKTEITMFAGQKFALEVPRPTNAKFFVGWYLGEQPLTDNEGNLLEEWELSDDATLTAKWADKKVVNEVQYIYSGEYPQTVITNENTISELSKITTVNEFGYIEYNGEQFEKVVYTQDLYQAWFNDGTPLEDGKAYYFLVEPVLWRVIDRNECKAITDQVIDTKYYYRSDVVNTEKPSVSTNNYEYSDINNWLNADGDYFDESFASKLYCGLGGVVDNIIFMPGLDNSLESTKDEVNPYVCGSFVTYFHILSCAEYVDIYKEVLGLTKATDYAICKGVMVNHYTMNAEWWLRTPSNVASNLAKYITSNGEVSYTNVTNDNIGIRPVASFKSLVILGGEENE